MEPATIMVGSLENQWSQVWKDLKKGNGLIEPIAFLPVSKMWHFFAQQRIVGLIRSVERFDWWSCELILVRIHVIREGT